MPAYFIVDQLEVTDPDTMKKYAAGVQATSRVADRSQAHTRGAIPVPMRRVVTVLACTRADAGSNR